MKLNFANCPLTTDHGLRTTDHRRFSAFRFPWSVKSSAYSTGQLAAFQRFSFFPVVPWSRGLVVSGLVVSGLRFLLSAFCFLLFP